MTAATLTPPASPESAARPAAWGAVLSLSLCVALLIAAEFMPVSLLTPMAAGLGATEGQTGQAIAVSGLFAVLTSLLLTTLAGRIDRKTVLVGLTGLMLVSLVMVAVAPSFAVLMIARAALGICVGGFWSLATATIMRLVPAAEVPRALAMMYGGQAIAAAFAAPLGSWMGDIIGWRGVFWALVPAVAANLIWHMAALPAMPAEGRQDLRALLALLRRRHFVPGLVAAMLSWGAAFTMFTYLRPFLEQVTGAGVRTLSVLLLVLGAAGFAGTSVAGRRVGGPIAPLLKLPALVMGAATLGLLLGGRSVLVVGALLAVWGAMNTAMSVIWMTWLTRTVEDAPEAAGSLMVAGIQGAILLGAMLGGFLLDHWSIQATLGGSVFLSALAVLLIGSGRALNRPAQG